MTNRARSPNPSRPNPTAGCAPRQRRARPTASYAPLFKALADPTRLEILGLLAAAGDELCVCDLEAHFDLSQPTISHHLRLLRDADLVLCERRGTWVYYALAADLAERLAACAALLRPSAPCPKPTPERRAQRNSIRTRECCR